MIGGQGEDSCGKRSLARKSTAMSKVIHTSLLIPLFAFRLDRFR
ncbi:hypothetical protein ABET09_08160 [Priestia megaterium]